MRTHDGHSVIDASRQNRERAGERRSVAARRDERSARADVAAEERDLAADQRDVERMKHRAEHEGTAHIEPELFWALRDRRDAAGDRVRAANDRLAALFDRIESARDEERESIDALTGAYRRDAGMVELARDLVAARRVGRQVAIGFVDVDGLKAVNDATGHSAGDNVLRAVADALRVHLRESDLIVRFGGDEFVISIVGLELEEVVAMIADANGHLAGIGAPSISCGYAVALAEETIADTIDRADRDLYRRRGRADADI